MRGPKITVIGAGSYFFGNPVIRKMAISEAMRNGTLALVDTNPETLRTMMRLARRVYKRTGCGVKVIGDVDRRKVMADSDFIVLTFSDRNTHFRGIDTEIAARHGIRMCSSDTIGPGGIFRSLREIPHAVAVARDAARLARNAWLINFVNPTAVIGMALRRYVPEIRSFALCDGHHEPYSTLNWCKTLGILPETAETVPPEVLGRLDLAIGGVNHFTALFRFNYDGKDMMPRLKRYVAAQAKAEKQSPGDHSKARFNWAYADQLFDVFGVYLDNIGHTKEYVPYFQGYGVKPSHPEPLRLFDADERAAAMADAWTNTTRYAKGQKSVDAYVRDIPGDHATDIIESMWGGLGKPFYINTANRGAIANLPADAFLESRCDVDMRGPRPQPLGEMPRGILGLQQQLLDSHELTAEAAVTGDRKVLRRAMLTDPICNNIDDADACIRDLLAAERDALPAYWYRRR